MSACCWDSGLTQRPALAVGQGSGCQGWGTSSPAHPGLDIQLLWVHGKQFGPQSSPTPHRVNSAELNQHQVPSGLPLLEFIMTWRQPAPQIKGHRIETQVQMSDSGQVLSSHVMLGVSK